MVVRCEGLKELRRDQQSINCFERPSLVLEDLVGNVEWDSKRLDRVGDGCYLNPVVVARVESNISRLIQDLKCADRKGPRGEV